MMVSLRLLRVRHTYRKTLSRSLNEVRRSSNSLQRDEVEFFKLPRKGNTLGPSLMRTEGISRRSMEDVFHQFGAPRSEIFSSRLSLSTRSGIFAVRKERDMVVLTKISE